MKGTDPGDTVEVWFEGGGSTSAHFTYTARERVAAPTVLIWRPRTTPPARPAQDTDGPALPRRTTRTRCDANGVAYDVYDVDARGNRAPDSLGVLGHYDAVIWYTGDDYLTRQPGQVPGTGTARLAIEEMIARRAIPQRGRQAAPTPASTPARSTSEGYEFRNFGFPEPTGASRRRSGATPTAFDEAADGCIQHNDDFLQYYLGAYIRVADGGKLVETMRRRRAVPVAAAPAAPFDGSLGLRRAGGARRRARRPRRSWSRVVAARHRARTTLLRSSRRGLAARRGAVHARSAASQYMAAGRDSAGYKRLTQTST